MQPNDAYMLIKMVNMQARWMIKLLKNTTYKKSLLIISNGDEQSTKNAALFICQVDIHYREELNLFYCKAKQLKIIEN